MLGRTAPLLSLSLLSAALIACGPESQGTDGDTDAPDTSTTDTSTGDPSTTDTSTGDPSTTDTSTTDTAGEACEAPDPAIQASVSVDLGQWPLVVDAYPDQIHVDADCTVQSATGDGGTIDLALLCTEGPLVDVPTGIVVDGPDDFVVDLVAGDAVKLDAYWQADGHHIFAGHWFTLHDEGGALLLAGLDLDAATASNDRLAPLTVDVAKDVCAPTCESNCDVDPPDTVERLALDFTHQGGATARVLDEGRAELIEGGLRFDIVVERAKLWSCLNCGAHHIWILRAADQP